MYFFWTTYWSLFSSEAVIGGGTGEAIVRYSVDIDWILNGVANLCK